MDELEAIRTRKMQELLKKTRAPVEPVKLSDGTFSEIINKEDLVVVDCWAEWCGPCKMLSPVIDLLAKVYAGKILFAKLNVDENPESAAKFNVMSIPTLLIFKDSILVDTIIGVVPRSHIENILNRYIAQN